MARKRGATDLSGILAIDKPAGVTSHDVVDAVRKATGEGRVGHAGTLDPAATGLLLVMVGPATRLAPYLTASHKTYAASIVFGSETDTCDAEGSVTATAEVPGRLADPALARKTLEAACGSMEQVPPAYSAVRLEGRKAYELARKGEEVEMAPREVELLEASLLDIKEGPPLTWDVSLQVSKGFYVRSFARDIGRMLGTVAHLGALQRTAIGETSIDTALSLERIEDAEDVSTLFTDPAAALDLPTLEVDKATASALGDGRPIAQVPSDAGDASLDITEGGSVSVVCGGMLLAICERKGESLFPVTVFPGGVEGVRR